DVLDVDVVGAAAGAVVEAAADDCRRGCVEGDCTVTDGDIQATGDGAVEVRRREITVAVAHAHAAVDGEGVAHGHFVGAFAHVQGKVAVERPTRADGYGVVAAAHEELGVAMEQVGVGGDGVSAAATTDVGTAVHRKVGPEGERQRGAVREGTQHVQVAADRIS